MAYLISADFPSVARLEASVLQLATPHRRQRVWTRIPKFLTRTIRSPAVAPLARELVLTGHIVNRIDRGHGEHISGEEDVLVEDVLYALGRNQHHDRENEIHQ